MLITAKTIRKLSERAVASTCSISCLRDLISDRRDTLRLFDDSTVMVPRSSESSSAAVLVRAVA